MPGHVDKRETPAVRQIQRCIPEVDRDSACALEEELAAPLRSDEPPVVGIVRDGRLLLDCRTLTDDEVDEVARAVAAARG